MEIGILPIGDIDTEDLEGIIKGLPKLLPFRARVLGRTPLPERSYDEWRKQYRSGDILGTIRGVTQGGPGVVLGIVDVDIFVPELNFVFGQADTATGVALISLTRLREEFFGNFPNQRLFRERALKEAVHEIGHLLGLPHCKSAGCIMRFSNSIKDTDRKGPGFCPACREKAGI